MFKRLIERVRHTCARLHLHRARALRISDSTPYTASAIMREDGVANFLARARRTAGALPPPVLVQSGVSYADSEETAVRKLRAKWRDANREIASFWPSPMDDRELGS